MTEIKTLHLFAPLDNNLIELLTSLRPDEWDLPTVAKKWKVRDIAAHLLDGNIRLISMMRDGYQPPIDTPISSHQDIVEYLNRINAEWVNAMRRVSPELLTDLLRQTGPEYTRLIAELDPQETAIFPVSWAGEHKSKNWFHIAREYTEKWHHQQQIRDATGKESIMTKEFYYPFLDTCMRALPHTYRDVKFPEGVGLKFTITGEGGGDWFLKQEDNWILVDELDCPEAELILDGEIAWKLFTKSWRKKDVLPFMKITGLPQLAEPALGMISVMA